VNFAWLAFASAVAVAAPPALAQCPDGSPPPCGPRRIARIPIAVLYFDNLSRDTADLYLAESLTEEVTDRLGGIERLQIRSRNTVRHLQRAGSGDATRLGRALNARYVVDGSVRAAGAQLRISVRLVRTADGSEVWAQSFTRRRSDLLALQEEIALATAQRIVGTLLPTEQARILQRPTRLPAAYGHFILGNYFLRQRSPARLALAIAEYQSAVALDPDFAAARARMAHALSFGARYGLTGPLAALRPESLDARALAMAREALRLDPRSSDAWMVIGNLSRDLDSQALATERAIELDPDNAEAQHMAAQFYRSIGNDSASLQSHHRALALEPNRAITLHGLGFTHLLLRDYAGARRWLDSAIAVDSGLAFAWLRRGEVRLATHDHAGALADLRRAASLGVANLPLMAIVAAATGDSAPARALLQTELTGWQRAQALIALGRHSEALDVLEAATPGRSSIGPGFVSRTSTRSAAIRDSGGCSSRTAPDCAGDRSRMDRHCARCHAGCRFRCTGPLAHAGDAQRDAGAAAPLGPAHRPPVPGPHRPLQAGQPPRHS